MPWRWDRHRESELEPPPRKAMTCVADVTFRAYCGQRALRHWMEDKALERADFINMWQPFKGFVVHLLLLACMNMTCIARLDRRMYFTQDALEDFYIHNHFPDGPVNQMITFDEVDTVERLWSFLDYLVDSAGEKAPPGITPENPLLGSIRVRQVRVRAGPCIVARWPDLAERFPRCYDFFEAATEDREPFGGGAGAGEAWTYRPDPEGDTAYGYLFSYPPGGYWIDLPRDGGSAKEAVVALKNGSWIDDASRAILVNLITYNANVNQLCSTAVCFELPPGGGVVPFLKILCAPLMQYATAFDFWRVGNEIFFVIATVFLTCVHLKHAYRHWKELPLLTTPWSSLMLALMLVLCWGSIACGLRRFDETTRVLLAMQGEGLAAPVRAEAFFYYELGYIRFLALAVFVAWLRTFQYHRVTTQVLVTLQRSRYDLMSYIVIYVAMHCAFAQAGYYLFGDQVSAFKTFSESALGIMAIALGEMRSDVFLATHWFTGSVYFTLLIFIVIFVFHNMFFVILSYNYDSVRDERSQLDRGLNFVAFIGNGLLQAVPKRWRREYDPQQDMERRLMRCGFSPGALQAFKALLNPKEKMRKIMRTQEIQTDVASSKDLNVIEEIVTAMEKEMLQAKSELVSLVSSLSGEVYWS